MVNKSERLTYISAQVKMAPLGSGGEELRVVEDVERQRRDEESVQQSCGPENPSVCVFLLAPLENEKITKIHHFVYFVWNFFVISVESYYRVLALLAFISCIYEFL